jgi:iron complex outermembrane recepter protein
VIRQSIRERLLASTMIGGAAIATLAAAPAFAQQAPQSGTTVQEVVVTGSRIKQPALTAVSPVTSVNSQEVKLEGTQNVEDLINNLPQAFADYGANESNGASGTATIDLRGLGDKRTLVLIDGERLAPGDPSLPVADVNFIPAALIDRVDVLTGGASAVYGSDAEAGVVNFIMKKNVTGLTIDAETSFDWHDNNNSQAQGLFNTTSKLYGVNYSYPQGTVVDGRRDTVTISGGANSSDGKGNVEFYFGYAHTDAVPESQRDFSACSAATNTSNTHQQLCGGSTTSYPGRFQPLPTSKADNGAGLGYTVTPGGGVANYGTSNLFNYAPYNYLQRNDERYSAGEFSHYDFDEHVSVYSSFMFMQDHTDAVIAPSGAFYGTEYQINCNANPLLSPAEVKALCVSPNAAGLQNIDIGRRNVEGLPRTSDLTHTSFRMQVGAKGEIADGWSYDVHMQYSRAQVVDQEDGYFSISKTNQALDVVTSPKTGQPVCAVTLTNASSTCLPYNIFGYSSAYANGFSPTAAALNSLAVNAISTGFTEEQIVTGDIAGDLGRYGVKSPWAHDGVGVSFGAEYRRDALSMNYDASFSSGDLAGLGGAPKDVDGAYDAKEIYGELRIPVIQDKFLIKDFSVSTGYRRSDYSLSGTVGSYMFGGDWEVDPNVRLRASFQRAVRAPNVLELFTPDAPGLYGGQDPCSGTKPQFTLQQCERTGVTPAEYGNISPCSAAQCNISSGGNTALKPEESDTTDIGLVLTPQFIRGFSLTVDYFNIVVNNPILTQSPNIAVEDCALGNISAYTCGLIHRDPTTGTLFGSGYVEDTPVNAGKLITRGMDFESNYRTRFADWHLPDLGGLNFNFVGTYVGHLYTQLPDGTSYDCAGLYGPTCGTPSPWWRHKFRVTWITPWKVDLSLQWRYIAAERLDFDSSEPALQTGVYDYADARIPAYNYFDLSATWQIRERLQFRIGINNLFDKDPPILDSTNYGVSAPAFGNANTYPQVYDSLGRVVFVGLTANF